VARAPTQLLATEWAAKKPAVNKDMPTRTVGNQSGRLSARPVIMTLMATMSTRRRPHASDIRPATADETVPDRYSMKTSPARVTGRLKGLAINRYPRKL